MVAVAIVLTMAACQEPSIGECGPHREAVLVDGEFAPNESSGELGAEIVAVTVDGDTLTLTRATDTGTESVSYALTER